MSTATRVPETHELEGDDALETLRRTGWGPLAGMIGILAWALLTSLAAYLGLAFAAQLEAIRAGVPSPATGQQANSQGRARPRRAALR